MTPLFRVVLRFGLFGAALVLAGACAASVEVTIDASVADTPEQPPSLDVQGSDRLTPSESRTSVPEPTGVGEPTPAASEPTPQGLPTAIPELPYEVAIDTYVANIELYWQAELPALSGQDFRPVNALTPYDPGQVDKVPACDGVVGPIDLYRGNAFYCEPDDYIAWDDVGLFPDLYRTYGDFSLGLVLAHEYAHGIQARLDAVGPTVFLELHADCLAGGWAGSVAMGRLGAVPFERADLDHAIGGFLTFADPRGTLAVDPGAHGTAFDRVNAFAEGFEGGAEACAQYLFDPPQTASILIRPDEPGGGDLPLDRLLPLLVEDLQQYLDALGESQIDPSFEPPGPPVEFGSGLGDPRRCGGAQPTADTVEGSAYYCQQDDIVYIDRPELEELWTEVGDFAPAYSIAHSYATAVVVEFIEADPSAAVLAGDCLVGVWARDIFDDVGRAPEARTHAIELSAGDLDEGIVGLVLVPQLGPSLAQPVGLRTFDRVSAFSTGFFRGVSNCPLSTG